MKQTNVNLEERQYQWLKELSEKENKSISQIIRELIDEELELKKYEIERDPILESSV